MRPNNLLEQARTYALLGSHASFELEMIWHDKDASSAAQRAEEITREIGAQVAQDNDTLKRFIARACQYR